MCADKAVEAANKASNAANGENGFMKMIMDNKLIAFFLLVIILALLYSYMNK